MSMKKILSLLSVAALCLGVAGCSDDDAVAPDEEVKTPVLHVTTPVSVAATAHRDKIVYTVENPAEGASVEAATTADWIGGFDCSTAGEVAFDVEANPGDARTATVTLSYPKAESVSVEVRQTAAGEDIELSQNHLAFVTAGGEMTVTVTSGRAWTLEGSSEWLTPSAVEGVSGDEVVFAASANEGDDPREATFVFHCGSGQVELTATQSYAERMIVGQAVYEVAAEGSTLVVTLQANADVEYSLAEDCDWLKPAASTNALEEKAFRFDVAANEGDARQTTITFTCGTVSEQVAVKQAGADLLAKIADEGLREYAQSAFDTDNDGRLSSDEAESVTELVYTAGAATAEGIGIFPNLTSLDLSNATFETLDLSGNTALTSVTLSSCKSLVSIDFTGCSAVTFLSVGLCSSLSEVDLSGMPALTDFIGYASGLTACDTSHNPELDRLSVYSSKIVALDLTGNPKLTSLNAGQSTLTSIDLSNCPLITSLTLSNSSSLTEVDVTKNTKVESLWLDYCDLRTVDTGTMAGLKTFSVSGNNNIVSIDISNNLNLETLYALCYPGDGEGSFKIYLRHSQYDTVDFWKTFCAEFVFVDEDEPEDLSQQIANERLRNYVLSNYDTDGDGKLSREEADAVTSISVSDVSSAEGLDLFPNLETLTLNYGYFSTIDLSGNPKLTSLSLNDNRSIQTLDLSANTALTSINVSSCDLRTLDIAGLSELNDLTISANNNFERLDISKNLKLTTLSASCYPGGGDGSWTLYLLRSQDETVSMWLGSCDKVYVD